MSFEFFNEQVYLLAYPDVEAAVTDGTYSSGLQHYIDYGQYEQTRVGFFLGTSGNDIITGEGVGNKVIAGVPFDALSGGAPTVGVGEVDTLIGGQGMDVFTLGYPIASAPQQFYVGSGNADYALIQNFQQFEDSIVLSGTPQDYSFQTVNGSLNISTAAGDLVGIVEGVSSLGQILSSMIPSSFITEFGLPVDSSGAFFVLV